MGKSPKKVKRDLSGRYVIKGPLRFHEPDVVKKFIDYLKSSDRKVKTSE